MGAWILTPAYGRDYGAAKVALHDFHRDKDFVLEATSDGPHFGGRYVNKSQIPTGTEVNIRYNRKTCIACTVVVRK